MGNLLDDLLKEAAKREMSPEEKEAQRRSFAYGNTSFENKNVTRELIDHVADSGDCTSCGEEMPKGECSLSKRPCGHHCNHSWSQDSCCWCDAKFDEEDPG